MKSRVAGSGFFGKGPNLWRGRRLPFKLYVIVTLASWLPARRVRRTALAETLNAQ